MNCFSCFQSQKSKRENGSPNPRQLAETMVPETNKKQKPGDGNKMEENREVDIGNIEAQSFTFRELASATRNFRQECLLGEGGFGRVYKGTIRSTGQVVAVKQLDRNGLQRNKEFLNEVMTLSLLHHPNLVNLIGYCADGDQRLLVFELMVGGSLDDHLLELGAERKPLKWFARMKIAFGVAKGVEYLHEKADPPVIFRDLKPSNILLDEDLTPKLSDFGLAKLSPSGDKMHPSSIVMGTYGYVAPEYARSGLLTQKSDVYSFGVILLELITGRRAIDTTKPIDEQNLVSWAQSKLKDPKKYPAMADPLLNKQFPEKDLNQVVAIAAMCLQEEPSARPLMSDVVTALSFLSIATAAADDEEDQEERAANNNNNNITTVDQQDDIDDESDMTMMMASRHQSEDTGGSSTSSDHNESSNSDDDGQSWGIGDSIDDQIRSENMELQQQERQQRRRSATTTVNNGDGEGKNSRRLRELIFTTSNGTLAGSHHGTTTTSTTTVSSNGGTSYRPASSYSSLTNKMISSKTTISSMNSLSQKSSSSSSMDSEDGRNYNRSHYNKMYL